MNELLAGIHHISWGMAAMMFMGLVLIYLAIKKDYEPALLLPIGFGTLLANIPFDAIMAAKQIAQLGLESQAAGHDPVTFLNNMGIMIESHNPLQLLFKYGIETDLFPLLIFIAIGAMIDFTILLKNPFMLLFGAAAQFGIFFAILVAAMFGFSIKEAAAICIIGAADGPTSVYVAKQFTKDLLGPISVAAYSYMALVPIIQPPIIRLCTTKAERLIKMESYNGAVSKKVKIIFPLAVTMIMGIIVPESVWLVGFLMFGNLIRECGVLDKLSKTAQNELASLVTIFLGITIASTMTADKFLRIDTLFVLGIGLIAFIADTAGGVLFAKFLNLFLKKKVNPMIGAAGISAFPMSARVIQKMGQQYDNQNFLLMPATSANAAGQIGSVIAGAIVIALLV
ncbi:MAG: sodium ion-translocating decarboxylase subunit beta [Candidatus Cloacimonetes bacterium]|nr:sodium ion-translocating decarboxylase subunit beta [Candidatus Cloacimonadota bacterium]